jgi:hypothetical protein
MIDFTMPVTRRRFRRRGSKVGSNFALEPRQRADCDENKLRHVRAPGERLQRRDLTARERRQALEKRIGGRGMTTTTRQHPSWLLKIIEAKRRAFDALSDEEKAAALDVQKERRQRVRAKRAASLSVRVTLDERALTAAAVAFAMGEIDKAELLRRITH